MRVVLLGAPGSGKGTLGTRLAEHYGVEHVSSGDLLRRHVRDATPLGVEVNRYVAAGELVPDELVLAVMGEAVRHAAGRGGYILDGFPRTLSQAERAYEASIPAGTTADAVLYLAVPDDIARERMTGRAVEGRADDRDPDVIVRRLAVFHAQTEPLLEFYNGRGILVEVDGSGSPDDVAAASTEALAKLIG
jgi:adenylate kinase